MNKDIELPGLDGSTLLGFCAGLGVLEALCATRNRNQPEPRLRWRRLGTWRPIVTGVATEEEIAERVLQDAYGELVNKVLAFRYLKVEKGGPKQVQSLSAPAAVYRAAVSSYLSSGDWRAADTLGSLMCEGASEAKSEEKTPSRQLLLNAGIDHDPDVPLDQVVSPTPFDFTSRNTQFLDQIRRVRSSLSPSVVIDDLLNGTGSPSERIMRWDSRVDMPGALFSRVAPAPRPAAEWLLFRGIVFFPLSVDGPATRVPGFSGRRKAGELAWVLWEQALPREVIRTLLGVKWASTSLAERLARGIADGFTVAFRKDATGYDGSVSPSRLLSPDSLSRDRSPVVGAGPANGA